MNLASAVEMTASQWMGRNVARDEVVGKSRSIVDAVRGSTRWDAKTVKGLVEDMSQCIVRVSSDLEGNWMSVFVLPPEGGRHGAETFTTHEMREVRSIVCCIFTHITLILLLTQIGKRRSSLISSQCKIMWGNAIRRTRVAGMK